MIISVFNYVCLKDCHPPEIQGCWHESRLVKLLAFCLSCRNFYLFLWVFDLFPKCPILWSNKCVIAYAKRKRPPLVRGHHWSPVSMDTLHHFIPLFWNGISIGKSLRKKIILFCTLYTFSPLNSLIGEGIFQ